MPHAAHIRLIEVRDRAAMGHASAIRRKVFIEEQHVPEAIEMDEDDAHAFHVIAFDYDTPVGCGRMVPHGDQVKIGGWPCYANGAARVSDARSSSI